MDSVTPQTAKTKFAHWTDHVLACIALFGVSLLVLLVADALSVEDRDVSIPALLWNHSLHVFGVLFERLWFYSALLAVGAFNSAVIVGGVQLLRHWDRRLSRALQRRTLVKRKDGRIQLQQPLTNWLEDHGTNRNGIEELVLKPLHQS
jgi:hypothetical protein